MSDEKLTPWFSAEVKPVHIGVYQVDDGDDIDGEWYAYYDGSRFGYRCWISAEDAYQSRMAKTDCKPMVAWRGLVVKP